MRSLLSSVRARLPRSRPHRAFGLDIGSTAVKVMEVRATPESYAVVHSARIPMATGVVGEGSIHDAPTAATAVRAAVAAAGIEGSDAVIGICGRELIIKKIQIPEVPVRELSGAIRIEAEHHIPFAIDEVFLGYQVTGRRDGLMDLTLVAAKKSKVLEYCAVVTTAGFTPVVVDVDGFALGNQHELAAGSEMERSALVDIGATMTKIAVVGERRTHFVRDVPFGGHRYTRAIGERLGLDLDDAEAIKTGRVPSPDVGVVAETCARISRDLAREIQRALDYYAETDVAAPPAARVWLVGGGAALVGLDHALAAILGLPVAVADPVAGLTVDATCAGMVASARPSLALALGLSFRYRGDSGAE